MDDRRGEEEEAAAVVVNAGIPPKDTARPYEEMLTVDKTTGLTNFLGLSFVVVYIRRDWQL